jgi:hypothetical protein
MIPCSSVLAIADGHALVAMNARTSANRPSGKRLREVEAS